MKMTRSCSYIKMKHSYIKMILASWKCLVLRQQQNLGRILGTSKMHLSPLPRGLGCCPKAVAMLLICLMLLPLWEYVFVLCFAVRYFMSILVLQSSWWGRESWLLGLVCLRGVSWLLCGSSLRCHGFVCSLRVWYFLIILTYYFTLYIYIITLTCQILIKRVLHS